MVKNPPAVWETWVLPLGWEDPLEEEMATTPVFLPGEFHGVTKSRTQLSDLSLLMVLSPKAAPF